MIRVVLLYLQLLMASAFQISIPNLSGCDLSAMKCVVNITSLISPSGCGIPPQSVFNSALDADTIEWAKCACPTLIPAFSCLNDTLSSCEPAQETLNKYGPLIKNGCLIISATNTNATNTTTVEARTDLTSTSTTPTVWPSVPASSGVVTINVSILSLLGVILFWKL